MRLQGHVTVHKKSNAVVSAVQWITVDIQRLEWITKFAKSWVFHVPSDSE